MRVRAHLVGDGSRVRGRLDLGDRLRWSPTFRRTGRTIPLVDIARAAMRTEVAGHVRPVRHLHLLLHDGGLVDFEVKRHDGIAEWFWAHGIPADLGE